MSRPLQWDRDGRIWPYRETSSFVESGGIRWHIQQMGSGHTVLLLHGTGASCHSWRGVMPELAKKFAVIAPDLPGHGYTRVSSRTDRTLPSVARAVWALLDTLEKTPTMIVGHSAGAAIAIQMLIERGAVLPVVGFNPALTPFPGFGAPFFPMMAKLLFLNPLVPRLFSGLARLPGETERFIYRATNSRIDAVGQRCYEKLLGNSAHCRGALAMMANWDLETLERRLPELENRVLFVHSEHDNAIKLASVRRAAERIPQAQLEVLADLGHLAHEERPEEAAAFVTAFFDKDAMYGSRAKPEGA